MRRDQLEVGRESAEAAMESGRQGRSDSSPMSGRLIRNDTTRCEYLSADRAARERRVAYVGWMGCLTCERVVPGL